MPSLLCVFRCGVASACVGGDVGGVEELRPRLVC